jgi:VWFA-related protein
MKFPRAMAALLLLTAAIAQDDKFTARTNLVFLPTRVQTKKGDTIYGLRPEQFVVEDNGVRQAVNIDEDPESSGLSLVVLVQCSRSAEDEMKKLKGLSLLIEAITGGAPHEVAVIAYGAEPYILGDFSRSSVETQIALTKLRDCSSRFNATIDNVRFAIHMLNRSKHPYRRAILLISERRDHGSKAKLDEVVAELGTTDTVIYSIAFSPARNGIVDDMRHGMDAYTTEAPKPEPKKPPPLEDDKPGMTSTERPPKINWPPELLLLVNALKGNAASEIAALSGGEYMTFSTQKNFEANMQRISNEIHNYYLLSFKPPSEGDGKLHTLRVRVPDEPNAVIQTRKSYWSGALPAGR